MAYKQLFVRELRERYKQLSAAIQPIPFIGGKLHCVDKVFVDGCIEYQAESWVPLCSYHLLFRESHLKSNRKILIGQPGFGKSTLALRLASDWCNGVQGSYLKDVEILILLQLRQLEGVTSIYKVIKRFLLSTRSQLTDHDIESILQSSSSVVFILDGFDEYLHRESSPKTDVMKIILSEMFQQFEVILTTRYLPKRYPSESLQCRLTGFDVRAQEEYITKVVGSDETVADRIKMLLQENSILQEICQVPLFCAMFVHLSQENKDLQTFSTLTSLFHDMVKYFQMNVRSKEEDKTQHKYYTSDESHVELDKIAFEGLTKENQQIVWKKQELVERFGEDLYDHYLRIGILVQDNVMENGNRSSDPCQIEARFFHKIFCEWCAAHHLAKCSGGTSDPQKLNEVLRFVDPLDLQYSFRFACGLNRDAAGKVIEFVKKRGANKIAILCFLELVSSAEDAVDIVKDLCRGKIQFDEEDSKLLHRSTVQLLEIASSKNISISYVELNKCYSTVDLPGTSHLQLKSNLCIPVLVTLKYLAINGDGKEITAEEFAAILQYSSNCRALQVLWFTDHVLPYSVQAEYISVFRSRRATVTWCPKTGYQRYQLNLRSCLWQHTYKSLSGRQEIRVMTFDDYERVVAKCRQKRK